RASASHARARHVERSFDDYAVQPLLPHRLSSLGPGVAATRDDGDGALLWFGGASGQRGVLLDDFRPWSGEQPSRVRWQPPVEHAACEDMGAAFVDFDGDGDLDLYVASGGVEVGADAALLRDRLYVNDGSGSFAPAAAGALPDVRVSSSCVAAADFDRDGDVDLFVGGRVVPGRFPHAPPSTLLRNDGGSFVDVTDEVAPMCRSLGMVAGACWTDLDDDGFVDLAVAAQWQPVRVLGNVAGARFVDRTGSLGLDAMRGQWNGVTSADLDGDGDFDLVVTNLGLNTKYKASVGKPMEIFARDFDDDGTLDVVEAKHSGNRTLPVRGLSCSSQAMPFVREKFPTFDQFAKATLGEIYGDALDECLTLSCNELRHLVLENQGARFVAHPLPRRAQLAPSLGVRAFDDDLDGVPEVFLAHNFFGPEPETGRFDGGVGLMMRRQGGLRFVAVPPAESGIVEPGDGRGVALIDRVRGDPLLLFVKNDGAHTGAEAAAWEQATAVVLDGPPGNPAGYGAKVTFERAGLPPVVREVLAGDGYLTQSSPVVHLPRAAGSVRVRWPTGDETTHELTGDQPRVTLRR
ncbi:MAG: CRTAC1 family protein, partial [Planctomycetota bacterium]